MWLLLRPMQISITRSLFVNDAYRDIGVCVGGNDDEDIFIATTMMR